MKRPILITSLCATLVGLGYAGVRHEANAELKRGISSFYAHLPPGVTFSYDAAYPRILSRGAGFTHVRLTRGPVTFTAERLLINAPSGAPRTGLHLTRVSAIRPQIISSTTNGYYPLKITMNAKNVMLQDVALPTLDADDKSLDAIAALMGTKVKHIASEKFEGDIQNIASDTAKVSTEVTPANNNFHIAISTLNIADIGYQLPRVTSAIDLEFSNRGPKPHEGIEAAPPKAELQIAYINNFPMVMLAHRDRTKSMDESLPRAIKQAYLNARTSVGASDGLINGWHAHLHPYVVQMQSDGDQFVISVPETPGFVEIPAAKPGESSRKINFFVASRTSGNTDEKTLQQKLSIESPGYGDLILNSDLLDRTSAVPTAKDVHDISIRSIRLAYRDRGLLAFAFQHIGAPEGISEEAMRDEVLASVQASARAYPILEPIPQYIASPEGRELVFSFLPRSPFALRTVSENPASSAQIIGTSLHVNVAP